MPKALKGCPKSEISPSLVTLWWGQSAINWLTNLLSVLIFCLTLYLPKGRTRDGIRETARLVHFIFNQILTFPNPQFETQFNWSLNFEALSIWITIRYIKHLKGILMLSCLSNRWWVFYLVNLRLMRLSKFNDKLKRQK